MDDYIPIWVTSDYLLPKVIAAKYYQQLERINNQMNDIAPVILSLGIDIPESWINNGVPFMNDYEVFQWMAENNVRFSKEDKAIVLWVSGNLYVAFIVTEDSKDIWSEYIVPAVYALKRKLLEELKSV